MYMGKYIDFIIPQCNNQEEIGSTIIEHITVNRIKHKKPCFMFITGESGEGKSYSGLAINKIITESYDLDFYDMMDHCIVYTPLEYSTKMRSLMFDKALKKLHVIMIDEARDLLSSKTWYDFVNYTINDINNQHRGVKPLVVIVISQDFSDISRSTRKTIQYRVKCSRPMGKNTRIKVKRLWKDERNIDNIKIRERSLRGYMRCNGFSKKVFVGDLVVKIPPSQICKRYDSHSFKMKADILKRKIDEIERRVQKELYGNYDKIQQLVDYYSMNDQLRNLITIRKGANYHIRSDFKEIHDLTSSEVSDFEKRFLEVCYEGDPK